MPDFVSIHHRRDNGKIETSEHCIVVLCCIFNFIYFRQCIFLYKYTVTKLTDLLTGAGHYSRAHQLCSHSRTSQHINHSLKGPYCHPMECYMLVCKQSVSLPLMLCATVEVCNAQASILRDSTSQINLMAEVTFSLEEL
jgi:hypothetical protein